MNAKLCFVMGIFFVSATFAVDQKLSLADLQSAQIGLNFSEELPFDNEEKTIQIGISNQNMCWISDSTRGVKAAKIDKDSRWTFVKKMPSLSADIFTYKLENQNGRNLELRCAIDIFNKDVDFTSFYNDPEIGLCKGKNGLVVLRKAQSMLRSASGPVYSIYLDCVKDKPNLTSQISISQLQDAFGRIGISMKFELPKPAVPDHGPAAGSNNPKSRN
jgi:hypothetical protein